MIEQHTATIYITKWWKSQGIVVANARRVGIHWSVNHAPVRSFFGTEGNDCETSASKARAAVRCKAQKQLRSLQKQAAAIEKQLADNAWPPVPEEQP